MSFLLFMTGLLLTRLVFIGSNRLTNTITLVVIAMLQLALVAAFQPSLGSLLLAVTLLLSLWLSERWLPERWCSESRLAGLLLTVLVLLVLHPAALPVAGLSLVSATWVSAWAGNLPAEPFWLILGALVLANEVNLLIRLAFHYFRLEPQLVSSTAESAVTLDEQEYNAGRIIGILERLIMYTVIVAAQNYNVIALIIAAKGFARFRQMDQRAFAEYVLIGTLMSTLLTILVSHTILFLTQGL